MEPAAERRHTPHKASYFSWVYGTTSLIAPTPLPHPRERGVSPSFQTQQWHPSAPLWDLSWEYSHCLHDGWAQVLQAFAQRLGGICLWEHPFEVILGCVLVPEGKCWSDGPWWFISSSRSPLPSREWPCSQERAFKCLKVLEGVVQLPALGEVGGISGLYRNSDRTETEQGMAPPSPWTVSQLVAQQQGALLFCSVLFLFTNLIKVTDPIVKIFFSWGFTHTLGAQLLQRNPS